jgi:hypothetical protein
VDVRNDVNLPYDGSPFLNHWDSEPNAIEFVSRPQVQITVSIHTSGRKYQILFRGAFLSSLGHSNCSLRARGDQTHASIMNNVRQHKQRD